MSEKSFVTIERVEKAVVGRISCASMGQREAPIIQEEVLKAAGEPPQIALDFSGVTMMGSLSLGMLVTLSKQAKAGGGKLVLFGLNENLRGVLKMSRLDQLLTIAKNEKAALKKV
ncbi:MAG: STAS domain-containing protein [Planctomycetota bacterium]